MHFLISSVLELFFFSLSFKKKNLNFHSPETQTESKSGKIQMKTYTLSPAFDGPGGLAGQNLTKAKEQPRNNWHLPLRCGQVQNLPVDQAGWHCPSSQPTRKVRLPLRQRCQCTPSPAQPVMPCTSTKRAACCVNVWMGIATHWNTNKTRQWQGTSRRRITKWQFASNRELRRTLLWEGVWRKNGSLNWRRTIDFKSLTGMRAQTSFHSDIKRPSALI